MLQILILSVLLFSIFIVDFIVKRNQITSTNAFAILYYTLLFVVFPEVLLDNNAILCSFFLLLSTRKIISLRSLKNVRMKIFDASLWVLVASLFYDWALLYLAVVFIAIYFYEPKNLKNWLVPFVAILTASVISYCVLMLMDYESFIEDHYQMHITLDTNFFAYWGNSTKLILYSIITIICGFIAFLKLGKLGLGRIITMRVIAILLAAGLVVTAIKASAEVYPILITFFPGAVLISKYVEIIKKINIKEWVLIVSVIAPFIFFITQLIIK
jgi:hypothetical protein